MMIRAVLFGLLCLLGTLVQAQDPDVYGMVDDSDMLREEVLNERTGGTESLLLDNTRSKIGRDFYDAFYRVFQELAPANNGPAANVPNLQDLATGNLLNPTATDTARVAQQQPLEFELNIFLVAVDELPANSGIGSIISVSINDELLFQQFIQNRIDTIEELANYAALTVREYIDNYAQTQRDLENEDLRGSGVY
jgi:hypothetical protein